MGEAVQSLFGGGRSQRRAVEAAQAQQAAALDAERGRLRAVEEGQRKVARSGRGLLAFVDEQLNKQLGG